MYISINKTIISLILLIFISSSSCKKFIEIDPPRTDIIRKIVFENDNTAKAAATDLLFQMSSAVGFASGGNNSISLIGALASDESFTLQSFFIGKKEINENAILPNNSEVLTLWSDLYRSIYTANAIIEGVELSNKLSDETKNQLQGEALFIRSFCHFYLTGFWGAVPLAMTTDYVINKNLGRSSREEIYQQLVSDLKKAKTLLSDNYSLSGTERIRPNKYAASALLARVYLYQKDWSNAETEASEIIDSTPLYSLEPLNQIFIKNNSEAIWQLFPQEGRPYDRITSRAYSGLQDNLINAFEPGDERKVNWVDVTSANKYTLNSTEYSEYTVVLRLAEQYLIRAEAKTHQNKILEAKEDINILRARANLPVTTANDKSSLLLAIEQERRIELFTEWGHRWFDLIRTERATTFLQSLKPSWQATDVLFPIPEQQIIRDPSMTQNPGY